jgi:hypothetical protein
MRTCRPTTCEDVERLSAAAENDPASTAFAKVVMLASKSII